MIEFYTLIGACFFIAFTGWIGIYITISLVGIYLLLLIYNKYAKKETLGDILDISTPFFGSLILLLIIGGLILLTNQNPLDQKTKDLIIKTVYFVFGIPFALLFASPFILVLIKKFKKKEKNK